MKAVKSLALRFSMVANNGRGGICARCIVAWLRLARGLESHKALIAGLLLQTVRSVANACQGRLAALPNERSSTEYIYKSITLICKSHSSSFPDSNIFHTIYLLHHDVLRCKTKAPLLTKFGRLGT